MRVNGESKEYHYRIGIEVQYIFFNTIGLLYLFRQESGFTG